jgi:hypothetical protein
MECLRSKISSAAATSAEAERQAQLLHAHTPKLRRLAFTVTSWGIQDSVKKAYDRLISGDSNGAVA